MLVGVPIFEVLQNAAWSSSVRIYVTEEENSRLRILYLKQECPSIRTNRLSSVSNADRKIPTRGYTDNAGNEVYRGLGIPAVCIGD